MMDVTEISSRLKVSKIMVYRYINTHEIKPVTKKGRTNFYDTKAFQTISKGLSREIKTNDETNDNHIETKDNHIETKDTNKDQKSCNNNDNDLIIEIMRNEIETKNEQIRELNSINKELTVALHQQQQLLLYEQQKTTQLLEQTQKEPESKWWQFWK